MKNTNTEHAGRLRKGEKLAIMVTKKIGTMGFFLVLVIWTFLWIIWNSFGPENYNFDPYPAFVLWLFISNMLQLFFLPLIMVGQNLLGRHAEIRAEADFEINKEAEEKIEEALRILRRLEKNIKDTL